MVRNIVLSMFKITLSLRNVLYYKLLVKQSMSASQGSSSPLLAPMQDYTMGSFSPAEFTDLNAGAGPASDVNRLTNTIGASKQLQQRFMSEITNASVDERDWIRTWRRKIKETVSKFNETFYDFLIRNDNKAGTDSEAIGKLRSLVIRISTNIPASSRNYFPELGWDISMNNVVGEVEKDLGLNIAELKESQKKVIRIYSDTLKELFIIDSRLNEKVNKLQQITDKLQAVMHLENNQELAAMTEPMVAYLSAVFKNNDISSDFVLFMMTYKKWLVLYDMVQLIRTTSQSNIPICCICSVSEVTHAMIPCGHTFCSGCITKQMTQCYICRTSIRDRLKLHFP